MSATQHVTWLSWTLEIFLSHQPHVFHIFLSHQLAITTTSLLHKTLEENNATQSLSQLLSPPLNKKHDELDSGRR